METPDNASETAAPADGDHAENTKSKTNTEEPEKDAAKPADTEGSKPALPELPADVKAKLRRLDKLESRYHGMRWVTETDKQPEVTNEIANTVSLV